MGAGSSSSVINHALSTKIKKLKDYYDSTNKHHQMTQFDDIFQNDNDLLIDLLSACVKHHSMSQHIEIGRGNIFRIDECDCHNVVIREEHLKRADTLKSSISPSRSMIVLRAEGLGLRSLELVDCIAADCRGAVLGLNARDNKLTDNIISSLTSSSFTSLRHLDLSRNRITNIQHLCITAPMTLQVLNISYCNLIFIPKCFVFCPYLKVLYLDGCNINCTYHPKISSRDPASSIFYGLTILEELSLSDNLLEDHPSLDGLEYFGKSFGISYNGEQYRPTMRMITLSGNRCESNLNGLMSYLVEKIPSLRMVNRKICKRLDDLDSSKKIGSSCKRSVMIRSNVASTSCMSDCSASHNLDPLM
jgi:hypothetical protein